MSADTGDVYDAVLSHPGRPASDLKRDPTDDPAAMLRLAGIKPGMRVADIVGGSGYYSELASYLVGPTGKVLLINNKESAQWSSGLEARLADKQIAERRAPHRRPQPHESTPAQLGRGAPGEGLSDLYWVDPKEWPQIDVSSVLDEVANALKPGGVVLVIDHSAKPGTGTADAIGCIASMKPMRCKTSRATDSSWSAGATPQAS